MADRTPVIGYHASHEQFDPGELLRLVQLAEAAGFDAAMCSDHLQPWSERQGQSGFAWAWLGAAHLGGDAAILPLVYVERTGRTLRRLRGDRGG